MQGCVSLGALALRLTARQRTRVVIALHGSTAPLQLMKETSWDTQGYPTPQQCWPKPFPLPSRYHGEKLPTFSKVKKLRQDAPILISTIYDDPDPKDSGDQLLRRQPPTAMKYRQDMAFVRASQGALESCGAQSR